MHEGCWGWKQQYNLNDESGVAGIHDKYSFAIDELQVERHYQAKNSQPSHRLLQERGINWLGEGCAWFFNQRVVPFEEDVPRNNSPNNAGEYVLALGNLSITYGSTILVDAGLYDACYHSFVEQVP